MAEPFVSGYLTDITIDAVVHSIWSNTAELEMDEGTVRKPVFGSKFPVKIRTQSDARLRSTGHISPAAAAALDAARLSDTPIAYIFQMGEVGGNNAGQYTGNGLVASLRLPADSENQIAFNLEVECTDAPVYVPGP